VRIAAASSNAACLRKLLLFGADPTSSSYDEEGRSVPSLAFAASRSSEDENALPVLNLLIDAGCDPNSMCHFGGNQQATAVFAIQNVSLLDALLKAGANPEIGTFEPPPRKQKTLLMLAVFQGEAGACETILNAGADIDAQSADGSTALMDAAFSDNEALVRLLIERGADIDIPGDNKRTALIIGATNASLAKRLLEAGADPNRALDNGISPLSRAIQEEDPELIDLFEHFGASPDRLPEHARERILHELNSCADQDIREHFASRYGIAANGEPESDDEPSPREIAEAVEAYLGTDPLASIKDVAKRIEDRAATDPEVIKVMQRASVAMAGAESRKSAKKAVGDVRERADKIGLAAASAAGDIEKVKELLDQGIESDEGIPSFAYAILTDQPAVFEVHVQKGVDVTATFDWTNSDGSISRATNGLILAVAARRDWAVERMLELGVDPGYETPKHETALLFAISMGYREAEELLFDKFTGFSQPALANALSSAATNGNAAAIARLLASGASVNSTVFGGWTPLKRATDSGHFEAVKLLLENGADCNIRDDEGWAPLLNAIENRDPNLVDLLLAHGADPNVAPPADAGRDSAGFSALMRAAHYGENEILRRLISAGADIHQVDSEGSSAIHYAAMHRHAECLKSLLDSGADISATNSESYTPLALFLIGLGPLASLESEVDEDEALEVLNLLLQNGADWNTAAEAAFAGSDSTQISVLGVAILGTELLELPRLAQALSNAAAH
jgi:ankyrin repeat protein